MEDFEIDAEETDEVETDCETDESEMDLVDIKGEASRLSERKKVGPPAEVQAMLDEEERNSLSADQDFGDPEPDVVMDGADMVEALAVVITEGNQGNEELRAPLLLRSLRNLR